MAERDSRGEDRRNMVWNLIEAESKSNGRKHGERERKLKEESFFVRFHLTTWIDDVSTIPNTEYFLCGKCVQKKLTKYRAVKLQSRLSRAVMEISSTRQQIEVDRNPV